MKIALVHMRHAHSGGTELFLNHLSRYLAEKGEDVTIICRSHVEPSHPAVKFVQLRPFSFGKAHRIWRFAKAVEKHIKVSDYDFVYGLGKTWSHDMLRIGGGTALHHLKYIKRRNPKLKDKIAVKIEKKAMATDAYHHIVTNSYKSANEVIEACQVPENKISVIHNFVDTRRFDRKRVSDEAELVRYELGIDKQKVVFLFLGTGYKRKGLKQALEAFSKIEIDSCLLIVGRDSHLDDYMKMAEELGVADDCKFIGESNKPEIYFSIADCYVLPALYEPFGFTVIEALSCGAPVVTSENCGAKEVLDPSVATVIGEDIDTDQLAAGMTKWAMLKGSDVLQKKCRDIALTLDVEVIMEKNYQQILSTYHSKDAAND
ncbi:MAG: glycosyltransferase family 4 protein [Pseudomonadota bacterium]